jgi:hypothetical protein
LWHFLCYVSYEHRNDMLDKNAKEVAA